MRSRLDQVYDTKRGLIKEGLQAAVTKIHLAFDMWTSPDRLAVLGVSGHFIDSQGVQQQRLLGLRDVAGAHSGENMAAVLMEVARDWGITQKVGVLVSDNASSNDVCGKEFFQQPDPTAILDPSVVPRREPEWYRIRCYGHILNLVGRAFLYGEDGESLEQESQALEVQGEVHNELRLRRRYGPVGKLRNIVKWVRSSPQRTHLFKVTVQEAIDEGSDVLL